MAEYVAAQHEDTGTVLLSSFIEPEGRKDTGTVLLSSLTKPGGQVP